MVDNKSVPSLPVEPQPDSPSPRQEFTNTLTEFNRERNLRFIVRLADHFARQRGENQVNILVVGASHEEMVSLANKAEYEEEHAYVEDRRKVTHHLLGLNYNPQEMQITSKPDFKEKMEKSKLAEHLLGKYEMRLHDIAKDPLDVEQFHALLINNVFVHLTFEEQKKMLLSAAKSLLLGGIFSMEEGRGMGYLGDKGLKRAGWVRNTAQIRAALESGELGFKAINDQELYIVSRFTREGFKQYHQEEKYYRWQGDNSNSR